MSRRSARVKDAAAAPATPLFEGMVFSITPKALKAEPGLDKGIQTHAGSVAATVSKQVTHVIALADEMQGTPAGKVKTALAKGTPVVSPDLIVKSVAAGKLEDVAAHTLDAAPAAAAAADDDDNDDGKDDAKDVKMDAAKDDDADDGTKDTPAAAKKRKAAAAKAATTAAASGSSSTAAAADDKDDKDDKPAAKKAKKDDTAAAAAAPAAKDDDKDDAKMVKLIKKGKAVVDTYCPGAATKHVVDTADGVFDVMLNQTNISANNNKFYVIQLLKDDSGSTHHVWTRWGRVGVSGQTKLSSFGSYAQAFSDFCKKFTDKTKNQWSERANFVKHPGKYFLIERDFGQWRQQAWACLPDSKLKPPVLDLMKLIFNMDMMSQQMMEIGYDAKKMPLGKLSKANIRKGYEVLKELSDVIQNPNVPSRQTKLMDLSSQFYTIIPHEFGMSRPPVISTLPALKLKLDMVEALGDIEIAASLIKDSKKAYDENPMDMNYRSLSCNLEPVERTSDTFKMVEEYTKKTHGSTHSYYGLEVLDVFDVDRQGETDRFVSSESDKLPNRMLLWHGSRLTNFVGILSQGLRIAPPEAPVTGYMFGKGVYFADMVSKSANYCCTNRQSNTGILLLCEVAIGTPRELENSDYYAGSKIDMKQYHSTKGVGSNAPDPAEYITMPDGVVVPSGKAINVGSYKNLLYNEYIVYSIEQIRIRYLVKMKFDYK
ncbi:poly polymerase catalytic domain-containing protein [Entophlyctis helioformis]|nr:poly polymerase catalytic domain-containing protein [Entophlyctis helioformis]